MIDVSLYGSGGEEFHLSLGPEENRTPQKAPVDVAKASGAVYNKPGFPWLRATGSFLVGMVGAPFALTIIGIPITVVFCLPLYRTLENYNKRLEQWEQRDRPLEGGEKPWM